MHQSLYNRCLKSIKNISDDSLMTTINNESSVSQIEFRCSGFASIDDTSKSSNNSERNSL